MDQASIEDLQPLYNGQLDFVRVIKPNQPAYADIRQWLLMPWKQAVIGTVFWISAQSPAPTNFFLLFENGYVISKEQSLKAIARKKNPLPLLTTSVVIIKRELTIDQLAQICGYSDTHFMNFFKKHLGYLAWNTWFNFACEKRLNSCNLYLARPRNCYTVWLLTISLTSIVSCSKQVLPNNS